ncbi:MAG TPA: flagellar basal body P-ring formation chaperone FlgA [Stellaceae bacterium]|nr:flagellar basal body P-ring formation chaperone FlgA [Stellaceae bacterium]
MSILSTIARRNLRIAFGAGVGVLLAAMAHAETVGDVAAVSNIDVPTLARAIRPGDIIVTGDIAWIQVPRVKLNPMIVTDVVDLIGHTPKRPLRAGDPVRNVDVQVPAAVKRNDLVDLSIATPFLQITTQGKALEDAAIGAAIRVQNVRSGKILEGVVIGPGRVAIRPPFGGMRS